jgi:surface carbohydrate biosynthesis protein
MLPSCPLYLLVEESFRELASRVCIAVLAAAAGRQCLIGQQLWFFHNFDRLPPGVVLFKGNNEAQTNAMARAKHEGHIITSTEEEVFGVIDYEIEPVYAPNADKFCDIFFVQGDAHQNYIKSRYPGLRSKTEIVGNPRTDLLLNNRTSNISKNLKEIENKYGKFILINTNYASVNPYDFDCYNYFRRCDSVGVYKANNPRDVARFHDMVTWEHQNFTAMVSLIEQLRRQLPEVPIVIRPHPSEWGDRWRWSYSQTRNVFVESGGTPATDWMRAATVTLHTSCTTGLEAYLQGDRAISLVLGRSRHDEAYASNLVNPVAPTPEHALDLVRNLILFGDDSPWTSSDFPTKLAPYLFMDSSRPTSERIADILLRSGPREGLQASPIDFKRLDFRVPPSNKRRIVKNSVTSNQFKELWEEQSAMLCSFARVEMTTLAPSLFAVSPI